MLLQSQPVLSFTHTFVREHPQAELFFVGGAVRDALLMRPTNDFDFVVRNMPPTQLEAWFSARGSLDFVGRDFGVFKFLPEGFSSDEHEFVDLALPRTEHATSNSLGAYRDVEVQMDPALPLQSDLSRRDFTVNAIAYDCRTQKISDPFDGREDLANRLIRTVGKPEERFDEDLTRILRAIRFASELQFGIEDTTWEALCDRVGGLMAKRDDGETFVVAREMLGKELAKALHADPETAVELLRDSGALFTLLPDLEPVLKKDPTYTNIITRVTTPSLTVTLALLLRGLAPVRAKAAVKELGLHTLPKKTLLSVDAEEIGWIIEQSTDETKLQSALAAPGSKFECFFANERGASFLAFLRATGKRTVAEAAERRTREILTLWNVSHHKHIPKLISGDDVLAAGVEAGPKVREILNRIRDGQLNGTIMRREQALQFLREHTQTKIPE